MVDQTVFEEDNTSIEEPAATVDPVETAPAPAPALELPDSVKDMVGEGKKYASAEEALKSIPYAQKHIESLEEEMASLREQIAKSKAIDEVLEALEQDNKTPPVEVPAPQVDPETLDALIDKRMMAKEEQAVKKANTKEVIEKLTKVFGDKERANQEYKNKAKSLGLSLEYLNSMAGFSPSAVFELFGINKTESAPPKVHSSINSEAAPAQVKEIKENKTVMGASNIADDVAAWRSSAPE